MKKIITPHQPQIAVEHTKELNALTITIDDCPSVSAENLDLLQVFDIPMNSIPSLISGLIETYEKVTGESLTSK